MLAAFWLAGSAAGVHEKERSLGVLRDRLDNFSAVVFQNIFDVEVAACDHGRFRLRMAGIAAPDEDFINVLAFFFGGFDGDVGVAFVIDPFSVPVVAVG